MQTIKDGTTEFEVKDMRYKAIIDLIYPVGTVIAFAKDEEPPVLKYGEWKEVPAGRFLQNAFGEHKAGETVEAGLPNLEGYFGVPSRNGDFKTDGKLFKHNKINLGGYASSSDRDQPRIDFNASSYNPIYGASDTVQPPAYIVHFYERVK